jgi:superfamily II DNA/RNA helicase
MEQNLNDKPLSNMQIARYIESLRKEMNFDDEVYGLVKSDLEDGLTQEQTEKYLDKNFNIGQMRVLSEGLHKEIPEELFNILHNNKLSGNQMKVSLEFYEKGVPVETIQEAVARGEKPVVMRRLYEEVLAQLSKAAEQYTQDSEYVKELIAQMEMVVEKINYQEERYDALNKKLSDVEVLKEDKEVTERLVKENEDIPAEEIAFIHDAKTDAQRDALFKEMRTGKKKVLIGSTDKCGTGVNVQTHLVAMHHVDCPWKPSSIEQREGRGIRQGNKNDEVAIYRYVTKQTFDAYNWSLVENKQRFISQVMTSKAVSRSCEDIDEATLSYAEIKAVATGNPLIREKMEVDNDVQRLKLLKASYDNQRYGLQDNFMIKYPKLIKTATEKLANVREDIKARDKELIDNPDFAITIGNATYTERVDGGTVMLEAISKCKTGETTPVGKFHGFELLVEKNFLSINYMVLRGKTEYKAELSTSPVGSMVKLENLFNGLHENIDFLEKKIEQYQNDLEASKAEYDKPFAYSAELEEKLARQYELNAQLDLENAKAMDADLGGPDEEKSEDRIENAGIVAEDKGIYMPDRNRKR